jgi:outer membrane lipoprotein-sorting protein
MISRLLATLGALALLSAAPAAAAARPSLPPDPEASGLTASLRLSALIERVKWEQSRLDTLEADFTQERASEFLARPEASHGRFSYASPDRVRWEYVDPKPISMVIRGDEMLTWYRDLGRAEKVRVGRVSSQVFRYLNATGSLDSLMGYFAITFAAPAAGEPYRLELKPRYPRIAKRLTGMALWIDRARYLPVRVRYVEPNGDTTDYRFENLRQNVPIPSDRFELALPKDVPVKVVDLDKGRVPSP